MKISFEENQFQVSSWGGVDNHWLLYFDDGVVEHGSSGSPILNQDRRVVGQLHGNHEYYHNIPIVLNQEQNMVGLIVPGQEAAQIPLV